MICPYCNKECERYDKVQTSYPAWNCHNHPMLVQFIDIKEGELWACTYTVYYRGTRMHVTVFKLSKSHQQWQLREGSKAIVEFDYIPKNLTPDNINNRINTLVVFS